MSSDNTAKIRRDKTYPYGGRLIVLQELNRTSPLEVLDLTQNFEIAFPAMPDEIELARQAEYQVASNMVVPDGVHQYKYTSPLNIPFSFSLHADDTEYCPDGALTLLRVAARLQALLIPLGDSKLAVNVANDGPLSTEGRPQPDALSPQNDASKLKNASDPTSAQQQVGFAVKNNNRIDPPVTCRLELIYTQEDEPGVVCTGYIKDVRTVLKGPWRRGPGRSFNLPMAGLFAFTFVHRPGHGNAFSTGINESVQSQAFADFVRTNLFNTRQLVNSANYRGFDSSK